MVNKKIILISFVMSLLLVGLALAQTWPATNVCCEKTKVNTGGTGGAWCQNTLEGNCDTSGGLRKTPTSCEATSFCKQGCCYNSEQGLCMENTPQKVCNDDNGVWLDDKECNIPQCELGCCVLGTQASFVTLTRCKTLSASYGLETNFRSDINDEATCIAIAASQDQGACVYNVNFQKTCRFTTRSECLSSQTGEEQISGVEFFKDYLCSAGNLSTNCGKSSKTTCVEGKDEVYFVDTCGNVANIYDAGKKDKQSYWEKKLDKSEVCGFGNDNAGSKNCGNCDYFGGSICSKGSASYGDYVCEDLNCYNTENGNDYKNGESWCIYDGNVGEGVDAVGSRHVRHVCISGEETIEPCADFRNEVCIQGQIESGGKTFREAACRVNRWNDCIDQDEEDDCLNTDKRDCYWQEGLHFTGLTSTTTTSSGSGSGQVFGGGLTGNAIFGGGDDDEEGGGATGSGIQIGGGACLPNVPNGLKFWNDGDASSVCSLGNSVCVVEYEKGLTSGKKCIENCECLEQGWAGQMNNVCTSLGDCGAYVNIAGRFTDDGAEWKVGGGKRILDGLMNEIKKRAGV